jgi:tRNA (guanine-N1)-methyltransferase
VLLPTPAGRLFLQRDAERYARAERLLIACGRYEGIDERVADWARADLGLRVEEISIGDYVLAGGGFPIAVKGAGVIGVIAVSGLPERQDHGVVVDALCDHLGVDKRKLVLAAE